MPLPDVPPQHPRSPAIAVVGATGAVGREMLAILEQRRFPHGGLLLFASQRSAGRTILYRAAEHAVEPLAARAFAGMHPGDLALFSAGASVSRAFAPAAAARGVIVIDNSSAFRMDPGVPLVIPEVNGGLLDRCVPGSTVANPNCSAIILLVALDPLRRAFGLERIVVSTYQAASGAGARAMEELRDQTRAALAGETRPHGVFPEPYAFNLFSHNAPVDPATGYNGEEQKMIDESRRIWDDPALEIVPTCIRVPVLRAHAESVHLTLKTPATEAQVRAALLAAPGVLVLDDRAANAFPTPLKASGGDAVVVGRIRPEPGTPTANATTRFCLFICGDQLRKGAALNAVQIAERLLASR